jgi:hypothetical protein
MKVKVIFGMLIGVAALGIILGVFHSRNRPANFESREQDANLAPKLPEPVTLEAVSGPQRIAHRASPSTLTALPAEEPVVATNKLERLMQIREAFHALAAGDPTVALRAAKQIADETQRETALLTLATEWTKGELSPPRQRARAIDLYGLEAGLGMELVGNPELAVLWANEVTDGPGRAALLQQTAAVMTDSDPASALALGEQLAQTDRQRFYEAVFAGWASKDTEAALQWAAQMPDPADQNAAIQAIRSVAPVGIGAALSMQDGYPVINQLLPGTPAETSGQIHPGDRILALAQGDSAFVGVQGVALQDVVQVIRGAPGTVLQLQVQAADAAPGSPPRIVSITRDQIKFKR